MRAQLSTRERRAPPVPAASSPLLGHITTEDITPCQDDFRYQESFDSRGVSAFLLIPASQGGRVAVCVINDVSIVIFALVCLSALLIVRAYSITSVVRILCGERHGY